MREILFNSRYGNTEDKEKITEIMELIVNRQAVDYDFSSDDKELLSSLDGKSFELGLYTEQMPGCVYSISVEREDWHYTMHLGKDGQLDVTYAVYLLLSKGE